MCGISGFINFDNFIDGKKIIDEMNRSLRHRGPDLSGTWNNEAKNIFLGHTRLSIIDLSNNGNQPMISRSGNKILIFNGEIYNHKLIRDKLSFNNWKGNSDSETLLECINEIGIENTLSEITGMFAFAIFDNNKQTLHLVRDRLGEKPLYYFYDKNKFIFASELKSILKFPKIQKTLNKNAINHFLKYSYIPSPITIYENIYKLNPSELISLKITKNKIQKKNIQLLVS